MHSNLQINTFEVEDVEGNFCQENYSPLSHLSGLVLCGNDTGGRQSRSATGDVVAKQSCGGGGQGGAKNTIFIPGMKNAKTQCFGFVVLFKDLNFGDVISCCLFDSGFFSK